MIVAFLYLQKNITKSGVFAANLVASTALMDLRKRMYKIFKNILIYGFLILGFALSYYFYDLGDKLLALIFLIIGVGYLLEIIFKKSTNKKIQFIVDLVIVTGFTCLISYFLIQLFN